MDHENILHGPKLCEELSNLSVGQQIYNSLLELQDLPAALVDPVTETTVSYKEIIKTTCCLADALKLNGYSKQSVIGICSENSIYYINPLLAALYLGCTVTAFNPSYTSGEFLHVANISKPTVMFCSKASLQRVLDIRAQMNYLTEIIVIDSYEDLHSVKSVNNYIPKAIRENTDFTSFKPIDVDASRDVAFILYSSGTTGLPKGVMLTHLNVSALFYIQRDPRYNIPRKPGSDVIIAFTPMFHVYGLFVLLIGVLKGQIAIVLSKFDPIIYLQSVEKYKIARLSIVPTIAKFLADSPLLDKFDMSSVIFIGCGTSPLSPSIEKRLKKRFINLKQFRQSYGMTETTLGVTSFYAYDHKVGSCGKLLPGMSAKIIDPHGKPLGPDCQGEICFKGPLVMKGYCGDEKSTHSAIDVDGWLSTGDVGYYDADGYFYIVDRIKELIKYKGFQVAPAELEILLQEHPKVLDVAVVGLPDPVAGELPLAFVVKKEGEHLSEEDVIEFVAQRVSPHKRLRGGVRFVQSIPKSASGKILRRLLRDQATSKSKL